MRNTYEFQTIQAYVAGKSVNPEIQEIKSALGDGAVILWLIIAVCLGVLAGLIFANEFAMHSSAQPIPASLSHPVHLLTQVSL